MLTTSLKLVEWSGGATGLDQWLPGCLPFRGWWQMAIRSCPRFPHPLCSSRTASLPRYGWKPALSLRALPQPSPAAFDAEPASLSGSGSESRGSTVYYPRACQRYYGLMRRSGGLRSAWACSACSVRSLPLRAVRLTFPSLSAVYGRACSSQGLPSPESAITTRPNHPLPRQDFHLRACPRLKAAHRNLLFLRARMYLTLRG
jgi:hypothetical protein